MRTIGLLVVLLGLGAGFAGADDEASTDALFCLDVCVEQLEACTIPCEGGGIESDCVKECTAQLADCYGGCQEVEAAYGEEDE